LLFALSSVEVIVKGRAKVRAFSKFAKIYVKKFRTLHPFKVQKISSSPIILIIN